MKLRNIWIGLCALVSMGCSPFSGEQVQTEDMATWNEDLAYTYLDSDESDGKQALKLAKKYGSYKDYYARFKVGNIAVVQGSTPAPAYVLDAGGSSGYLGVILGQKPRFVALPNSELFAHFIRVLRQNPSQLKDSQKYRVLSILAGTPEPASMGDIGEERSKIYHLTSVDPTWNDENGILIITYYSEVSESAMTAPLPVKCTLMVDAEQKFTSKCDKLVPDMAEVESLR